MRRYDRHIKIGIYLFLFFLVSANLSAENFRCEKCSLVIEDATFIKVNDKYYHPRHFLCNYCDKIINGTYVISSKKNFHQDCFSENILPSCDFCGKKLGEHYSVFEGKSYHSKCYDNNIALRCDLCGKSISGGYMFDYWGQVYHDFHLDNEIACAFCSRLISSRVTEGGVKYDNGTGICNLCLKSAVDRIDQAEDFRDISLEMFDNLGLSLGSIEIPVSLVSQERLNKISRLKHSSPLGITRYKKKIRSGFFSDDIVKEYSVYLLKGMPEVLFKSVLAHELMHVWIYENGTGDANLDLVEGSCNYLSFIALGIEKSRRGTKSAEAGFYIEQMLLDKNEAYGEGFRKTKKMVESNSLIYLLEYLRFNKSLP